MASAWMLVEDEPDLYEILSTLLELWGHDVVAFQNGEDAVAWLQEVEQGMYTDDALPELGLIDIRLPGEIDGIEICKQLRQNTLLSHIPVILTTAYALTDGQKEQIIADTQADLLLHKPLPNAPQFHKLLDEVIVRKRVR
jgi:CheY-like chemotaxis protein